MRQADGSGPFHEKITGIVMMLLTSLLFAVMAVMVRLASQTIPVGMIIFTRYVISTVFIALLWRAGAVSIRPVNKKLLALRAISASFGAIFYFSAVSMITIPEAVILKYTYPLFAVTFASILYGEKTDTLVKVLMLTSIAGIVIMVNPAYFSLSLGHVWGVMTGVSAGAAVAFVRKLRETDDSSTIMFATSFAGALISLPLLSGGVTLPSGRPLLWMLTAASCGIAAQYALVYGMKFVKTGSACVIMMLEVVMTASLGFIILGHTINTIKILGGILILSGGVIITLLEARRK